MTYNNDSKQLPKLDIGEGYQVTNYCSLCPNSNQCGDFSFVAIMYSKVPSILALSQLSINRLQALGLTEAEYMRLVSYNIRYIAFIEDMYHFYKKVLQSMQSAQFKFDVKAYMIIDEMFNLFIKWFEKITFWNKINSIKPKRCTYYRELLSESIDFIFDLFVNNISNHNNEVIEIIQPNVLKEVFKKFLTNTDKIPETNGEYFNHTQMIKQHLSVLLEAVTFIILSYFRTVQTGKIFLYVTPSYFIPDYKDTFMDIIVHFIERMKKRLNIDTVIIKPVTGNVTIYGEVIVAVTNALQKRIPGIHITVC